MHSVTWFELPTKDLERAAAFYEKVLGLSLKREVFFGVPHAIADDILLQLSQGLQQSFADQGMIFHHQHIQHATTFCSLREIAKVPC